MQKKFTYIVNHFVFLGNVFSNEDLINKVLKCLSNNDNKKWLHLHNQKNLKRTSCFIGWKTSRIWNGTNETLKMSKERKTLHSNHPSMKKMTKKT